MERIRSVNPSLTIIDARETIKLRDMEHGHSLPQLSAQTHTHDPGLKDPHIWTNPLYVKQFMGHFTTTLSGLYPNYASLFKRNFARFAVELVELDNKIQAIFQNVPVKHFLVFHPSWGYFADHYGLTQISIELEVKTPNAKELATVIDYAKQHNIKRVFVQKQFSQKDAQAVANAIGGKVIAVDPLAENYIQNLIEVAQQFAGGMT
jgi:zinc transport system substrate-binding protein